jgi:ABC-type dipeptide/oligopeptide/nickel transport system permease subunit
VIGLVDVPQLDQVGRDLFSRVLIASRLDLAIAFSSVLLSFLIGTFVGGAAAYLLSDDAKNVTATTLYVDAGYHAMGM